MGMGISPKIGNGDGREWDLNRWEWEGMGMLKAIASHLYYGLEVGCSVCTVGRAGGILCRDAHSLFHCWHVADFVVLSQTQETDRSWRYAAQAVWTDSLEITQGGWYFGNTEASALSWNSSNYFQMAPLLNTRGHKFKLYKKRCSAIVRSKFFSEHVVNTWNNLPSSVDFSLLSSFIRTVKLTGLSAYLRCF